MHRPNLPIVPKIDSLPVKNLLNQLKLTGIPIHVNCHLELDADYDECFINVSKKVLSNGGRAIIGWAIWELPKIIIEAQFHSIWESPEGKFVDITPRKGNFDKVLFIEDPNLTYEGYQRNNVRIPLYQFEPIRDFIAIEDRKYEILNKNERRFQHGKIKLTGAEANEMRKLDYAKMLLEMKIFNYTPSPNSQCICGSGKKFKKCCSFLS